MRDAQRWWGQMHLPLLNVFKNPSIAFEQFNNHPVVLATLVFYTLTKFLRWDSVINGPETFSRLTSLLHAINNRLLFAFFVDALGVLILTFQAVTIHSAAKSLGTFNSKAAHAIFKALWCITLFLAAVCNLLQAIPGLPKHLAWGITAWGAVWLIWAIHVIYDFSVAKSIGTWALSWFFNAVILLGIGLIVSISAFFNPSLLQKHRPLSLQRTNQPAAYNWQVHTLDGKTISVSELKGKVIFLNFWATWCLPCRVEMRSIQHLYDHFKSNPKIAFLCISNENAETVGNFVRKTKYSFPIYVTDGMLLPAIFNPQAFPVTYIISPQGQVVGQHVGANAWDSDASIQLLQGLTQSTTTAEMSTIANFPKLLPGELNIPLHPMVNLNFRSKHDILAMRRTQILKQPRLAPPHYEPDAEIFQIVDGKPWWGTAGIFFYGQGMKSIEGLSGESRFLLNPFLLVGLSEGYVMASPAVPPEKDDYVAQARALRWRISEKKATAYYDFSNYLVFSEHIRSLQAARMLMLNTINARDFGFRYIAIDHTRTQGVDIDNSSKPLIPLAGYINLGNSCLYPGGCNNFTHDQKELHVEVKNLPARITLQLWRNRPFGAQRTQPDMTFELILQ